MPHDASFLSARCHCKGRNCHAATTDDSWSKETAHLSARSVLEDLSVGTIQSWRHFPETPARTSQLTLWALVTGNSTTRARPERESLPLGMMPPNGWANWSDSRSACRFFHERPPSHPRYRGKNRSRECATIQTAEIRRSFRQGWKKSRFIYPGLIHL